MGQQVVMQGRGSGQNSTAGAVDQTKNDLPANKSFSIPASGSRCSDITRRKLILLDLPNECLQCIAEFLKSEKDINAFAQTNHRLYDVLNTYLYRRNVQLGSSALLWAASRGKDATAQILLAEGANFQVLDGHGRTPLLLAVMNGYKAVVTLLLATESRELKYSDIRTSLILATQDRREAMEHLIQNTADIEAKDEVGGTALTLAIENGSEEACQILLAKGAKVDYHFTLPQRDYTFPHNGVSESDLG